MHWKSLLENLFPSTASEIPEVDPSAEVAPFGIELELGYHL